MILNRLSYRNRPQARGFTLTEMMIAAAIGMTAFAMAATALVSFQFSTRTTYKQLAKREANQKALKELGRLVMHSSAVVVEDVAEGTPVVHVWHDDQEVWTPETIIDDTEGIVYLDEETGELRYRENVTQPFGERLLATGLEQADFYLVGNALFITLTCEYDPDTPGSERVMRASFVTRNNPKLREDASE